MRLLDIITHISHNTIEKGNLFSKKDKKYMLFSIIDQVATLFCFFIQYVLCFSVHNGNQPYLTYKALSEVIMKKSVLLSISGLQNPNTQDEDNISLLTEGFLFRRGKQFYISYEESELTGLRDTNTVISVSEHRVSITRTGKYPSKMLFETGKSHMSVYPTDYGSLTIAVSTKGIENRLTDEGGELDIRYDIQIDNVHVASTILRVQATLKDDNNKSEETAI